MVFKIWNAGNALYEQHNKIDKECLFSLPVSGPWADRERAGIVIRAQQFVRCVHISGLYCLRGNGMPFQ